MKKTVEIELTPEELGAELARMDSDQQADALAYMAAHMFTWRPFARDTQALFIGRILRIRPNGAEVIELLKSIVEAYDDARTN